ncbi:hypothetical protein TNIN_149101 [Trichonephila inaurata madagascariensis]|uniref:Uncharacterized protein n=1 Tax=Trichonephila inaurata madagascariensis TaxID=2747483 RepID=A0A8X6XAM2_9ARAC|nr:hypothetical protein TNIN_149101 [Trichonephila inaurata madagascariensis]
MQTYQSVTQMWSRSLLVNEKKGAEICDKTAYRAKQSTVDQLFYHYQSIIDPRKATSESHWDLLGSISCIRLGQESEIH